MMVLFSQIISVGKNSRTYTTYSCLLTMLTTHTLLHPLLTTNRFLLSNIFFFSYCILRLNSLRVIAYLGLCFKEHNASFVILTRLGSGLFGLRENHNRIHCSLCLVSSTTSTLTPKESFLSSSIL